MITADHTRKFMMGSFCTPVHRSAQACMTGPDSKFFRTKQRFPQPLCPGAAASAWLYDCIDCDSFPCLEAFHGTQGPLEKRMHWLLPKARVSLERPCEFFGHLSRSRAASPQGRTRMSEAEAEFARASGHGLRRIILDPQGITVILIARSPRSMLRGMRSLLDSSRERNMQKN
jgi:hypothetical protein